MAKSAGAPTDQEEVFESTLAEQLLSVSSQCRTEVRSSPRHRFVGWSHVQLPPAGWQPAVREELKDKMATCKSLLDSYRRLYAKTVCAAHAPHEGTGPIPAF